MRYLELAEQLRSRIAQGAYVPTGGAIESEAELARDHRVSRVTVRRALELLRDEGLLTSRRGAGWFVVTDPVRQTLSRITTVEAAIEASGVAASRRVLEFSFEAATRDIAAALECRTGTEVLHVRRLNLAGGEPFGLVSVWVPATLGGQLSRRDVETSTFYDLLPLQGVELAGARQSITATAATAEEARLLKVRGGAPLLACRRVTRDVRGTPVLFSEHRYPGHRTAFEIEFGYAASAATAGPPPTYPSRRNLRVLGDRHG